MNEYCSNRIRQRRLFTGFTIVFICLVIGCSGTGRQAYDYEDILVKQVIDGDTLILENGQKVRLIGIDTPEIHYSDKLYNQAQRRKTDIQAIMAQGRKAYEFTRNLVEYKRLRLEFDLEKYDKYNRLLCYAFLKDGTFVNAEIIEAGYASLLTIPPNVRYADLFRQLYQDAQTNNRGLWADN